MYEIYQEDTFFRRAVVENYLVYYNVAETEDIVRIYRILHGSRDLRHYLNRE
jgi:plasmid stabilization system protein ParE